jgi:hypothetical protein
MWEGRWQLRAFGSVARGEDRFAIEDTYACQRSFVNQNSQFLTLDPY